MSIARRVAVDVLRRVEAEGAYGQLALNHALERRALLPDDRALCTSLVNGVLRWRRRLDFALAAHSQRPLERIEPALLRILRMTAYQLLFLDRVPEWAAVDEATQLAVQMRGQRAGGFVNAVSRALARTRERVEWPDPDRDMPVHALGVLQSFPDWMVEQWLARFGRERAVALMEAMNRPPPLWVRANSLRVKPDGLISLLEASGIGAKRLSDVPGAIRLEDARSLTDAAAHEAGFLHIQDAAAQAICHLLDPRPGERVLDACGAPGGKTATIAQLMNDEGELLTVDLHPARLGLARKLVDLLGIGIVQTVAADICEAGEGLGLFDRVLLDAPCSGLGVIRRHPETKWRTYEGDPDRLAQIQRELLDATSRLVRPGGKLVYSVCTFTASEGEALIDSWLEAHPDFARDDPRQARRAPWHALLDARGQLCTWPDLHDMDAFFGVRLARSA
ncbi:MAG: 16S rRNA (cytosine(967)-C(5))-methyltransferase RsmB [Deltaproteobacteria bacterium]|nr:16S rRNA (cytosine(967)-C(5))-methyltransferase RsmB [Deltaproteobacteria bacterium]